MASSVRKDSIVPLYYQLRQILCEQIETRVFKPHQQIPSEPTLQQRYGLSRATVRKSIDMLVREGLVYRIHGKGTFVAEPKDSRLIDLDSFTENMRAYGFEPSTIVLETKLLTEQSHEVAQKMGLEEGEGLILIRRLRFLDGKPILLATSFLPSSLFPGLEKEQLTGSLYETLLTKYGIMPSWGEDFIEPVIIGAEDARLLDTEAGGPALLVERHAYTKDNDLVEICYSLIRGDEAKLYLKRNN